MVVAILVVLGAFLLQKFAGEAVGRFALVVGRPFGGVYSAISRNVGFVGEFFKTKSSLIKENESLRAYIISNEEKTERFEALNHEYQELLALHGRSTTTTNSVVAHVISKPPQSPYDVLVVDVGSANGIVDDSLVFSIGGALVGQVEEVSSNTSKVVMFSSVGQETDASVERTGESIKVVGMGGGTLQAEVAQEMDIIVDDTVVLPDFGGFVVASVASVDSSVTSAFKKVLFRAPVSISNLRFVEIH